MTMYPLMNLINVGSRLIFTVRDADSGGSEQKEGTVVYIVHDGDNTKMNAETEDGTIHYLRPGDIRQLLP
ncbi:hypothetical protein H4R33_001290 [Dimargaris cristalligena]|nr:hypothetical protein H4R33_001290 [Dimargaris cristalligena]